MTNLNIDIETYSEANLKTVGVYRYVNDPSFEILLFAYSIDGHPAEIVDMASGEKLPAQVLAYLTSPYCVKHAYNAAFERVCISAYLGLSLPVTQWRCTLVRAAMVGLPLNLDAAGTILKVPELKDKRGNNLIRYFSMPCKPTKTNGYRFRNGPEDDPVKWEEYKQYCKQDVRTEQAISKALSFFDVPDVEQRLYTLDQQINDRGVMIDLDLVNRAIEIDSFNRATLTKEAKALTGLGNPNSLSQLKKWLGDQTGEEVKDLRKEDVPKLIKGTDNPDVKKDATYKAGNG